MANITTLKVSGAGHISRGANVKVPYLVENIIDYADALAAKGSALAASDTIEAITVPAGTIVRSVGAEIVTAADSTTLTLDIGLTGGDVDEFVDGLDGKATAGTYSPYLAATDMLAPSTSADTIDVLFATLTGTLTSGKVRVWAEFLDVSGKKAPGLAVLAS